MLEGEADFAGAEEGLSIYGWLFRVSDCSKRVEVDDGLKMENEREVNDGDETCCWREACLFFAELCFRHLLFCRQSVDGVGI